MHLAQKWCDEPVAWLLVGEIAYRVRRVDSDAIRREGYAHLEGSEAYAAVYREIASERRAQLAGLGQHESEEARAAAIEEARRVEARRAATAISRLTETREGAAALRDRCDAYLCAAVDAAAELAEPVAEPSVVYECPTVLGEWAPWRWTRDPDEHDPASGVVSIGMLPESVRGVLGLAVQGVLQRATRRRAEPFRQRS